MKASEKTLEQMEKKEPEKREENGKTESTRKQLEGKEKRRN